MSRITDAKNLIVSKHTIVLNKYNTLVSLVSSINTDSDPGSNPLILTSSFASLSNNSYLVEPSTFEIDFASRGKDLLLIADQSDQFICTSLDTFSRCVDSYIFINESSYVHTIELEFNVLENDIDQMINYLNSRRAETSVVYTNATVLTFNIIGLAFKNSVDSILTARGLFSDIVAETDKILKIFPKILLVNTTVSIALSISEKAWNELKLIGALHYEITKVHEPLITETETNPILTNTLVETKVLQNYSKDIFEDVPRVLLASGEHKNYKIFNTKDEETIDVNIPDIFKKMTSSNVATIARKIHPHLELAFGYVSFFSYFNTILTNDILSYWFEDKYGHLYEYEIFKNFFTSDAYIQFAAKFANETSEIVTSFTEQISKNFQTNSLNAYLTSVGQPIISIDNTGNLDSVFTGSDVFNANVDAFIREKYASYRVSSEFNNQKTVFINNYLDARRFIPLKNVSASGVSKIVKYDNEERKIRKILSEYKYSYSIYTDDIYIYYGEFLINDNHYVYIDGTIQNVTNFKNDVFGLIATLQSDRNVKLTSIYESFLNGETSQSVSVTDIHEISTYISTENVSGLEKTTKVDISNVGDIVTKTSDIERITTDYVEADPIIRLTTNITNIYRSLMIDEKVDFNKARIQSILGSFQKLGYQFELENYINMTWDAGIPRVERG